MSDGSCAPIAAHLPACCQHPLLHSTAHCPAAAELPSTTLRSASATPSFPHLCRPCPFGHTSKSGARSKQECEPIPQACPVGQIALAGAISTQQCVCLPGHGGGRNSGDPCAPCPPGTWAGGDNTQPCVPCGFGYTSPEAATCPEECYPINACPAGTQYPHHEHGGVPVSIEQCVCKVRRGQPHYAAARSGVFCWLASLRRKLRSKGLVSGRCVCHAGGTSITANNLCLLCAGLTPQPGFGSSTGKGICSLCPVGTFSDGGSMEDCQVGAGFGRQSLHTACYTCDRSPAHLLRLRSLACAARRMSGTCLAVESKPCKASSAS